MKLLANFSVVYLFLKQQRDRAKRDGLIFLSLIFLIFFV